MFYFKQEDFQSSNYKKTNQVKKKKSRNGRRFQKEEFSKLCLEFLYKIVGTLGSYILYFIHA